MRIRIGCAISTMVLIAGFLACSKDSGNPVSPPPSTTHRKVIEMRDNFFSPKDLVISVGDTVEWVNVGNNQHTTTSGTGCTADGIWNSGLLSKGGKFMAIFDASHISNTGLLPYFCIPHCAVNMRGSITVNP